MHYHIRHHTRFVYAAPIAESLTEVRMHPRTTTHQHCSLFRLQVRPAAHLFSYQDYLGNEVHHFTQPGLHQSLSIIAISEVQVTPRPALPETLPLDTWAQVDAAAVSAEYWEMAVPSEFTEPTEQLALLASTLDVTRRSDPLSMLVELNRALHRTFAYDADSTHVDSPIDEALRHRRGVCQDFAHIMLALARNYLHIPCRYVSGYLYHRRDDRSADGATHAWIEALLPELGWIGFDPTNNLLAGERHIEVAVGRDYHDVPPTRGVYKGNAASELSVNVRVRASHDPDHPVQDHEAIETPAYRSTEQALQDRYAQALLAMQIQQQQQQQQ